MSKDVDINLIIQNDVEWRKHLVNMQQQTFNKIDEIKEDFSTQKILCENRITKIETKSKSNSKIYGTVFGIVAGTLTASLTFLIKWIANK